MTGAQFKARVYQVLGIPSTHPEVPTDVIADNFVARVDELTLLVKPPTMRKSVSRAVVANSATIYLPADHLQTIAITMADSNGRHAPLANHTQEDLDGIDPAWQSAAQATESCYTYAGIVATPGANSYGQRIIRVVPTPTVSAAAGVTVRYWVRASDLITGTNSQYQIVQVPLSYHLGLVHGVAGLIATDPRLNRDPIPHLQIWQDTVTRYQHYGNQHREYDYNATGYSGIAASQARHWGGY